jgi:glycine oxidase
MPLADRQLGRAGQFSADLVVVGGGIAGLWTTLKALRAGLSVILIEKTGVGAGASGGFMGALMPHMPERWDGKKQFQFDALCALEAEAARLESETGLPVHYRRVGRLTPLSAERQRDQAAARIEAAKPVWDDRFAVSLPAADSFAGWLDPTRATCGVVFDDLSARISPLHLLASLEVAIGAQPKSGFIPGEVTTIDPAGKTAHLADGGTVLFGAIVIANGLGAFPLIESLTGAPAGSLGNPVKGQAALFEVDRLPDHPDRLPVLFDNGVYVIAHGDGTVAVGATSETAFDDPNGTDEQLDAVIAKAGALSPAMAGARLVRRWAGLRPRPAGRDPMLGQIPGNPDVYAVAGGYKITFGIAHHMAHAVVARITGIGGPEIPPSFSLETHVERSKTRAAEKRG